MDVCTWPVLNLVLLATASCIRRFSLGMLSLMAVLNMTKSLSLFEICIIQSLVIAANIFLSPLLATLPVKEKYVLLLVACVELMTATVYL